MRIGKDKGAIGEDNQRALELSFAYGCGCCVFKHDIYGDQPEFCAGLGCPPVLASFEDAIVGVHRRKVAEEPGRGVPLGDLNGTSTFSYSFYFFRNGPNMIALFLPYFSVVTLIWPLFFFLFFP